MTKSIIKLDSRTLLILILISNIAVFLMPTTTGEALLMGGVFLLGILCGAYGSTIKLGIFYVAFLVFDILISYYMGNTWLIYIAVGMRFIRRIVPTGMIGFILISKVSVSEIMASLKKMHVSDRITIPLTVLLRYFPTIGRDRKAIHKATVLRGVSGSFITHPIQSIECIYVPLLLAAARRSDELSSAAVTRGIENPKPHTTLCEVKMGFTDISTVIIAVIWAVFCLFGGTI